ncbi:phosphate/phosphite/phosphonate ABC transporter substrate-binding protein [Caloranaerobacter ferrireducens]|uniref:phosphate/phosphite/phosphonate ABC transporter substrate-binding protein n=1 Tax=Caloranaerobacter ferrireducens TaxID=1323370 RepID=UPI00084CE78C|nr:phosphate/phosphite/phosphonate ABC transporter substrate-binding protein [Caloranaerobacter ferrireducens]
MKKLLLLVLVLSLTFSLLACSNVNTSVNNEEQMSQEKIVIGVIPAQNQGKMKIAMDKLGSYLSNKLNMNVEVNVYSDYNGVVEAMNYGKVDLAYFGPLTYVIAHEKSNAEAIITMLINGEPYYYSYIIVPNDSPYNSIEDLIKDVENIEFAFGDPNSTSGCLIPSIKFKELGVFRSETDYDFKNVVYTGSHDATAKAIENKKIDAGAIDSAIFEIMKKNKVIDASKFKVIWKSDKLFQYPWAVKNNFPIELKEKLIEAFLEIKDQEILDVFGANGFTRANDKDYEPIRKAAKEAGRI